MSGDHGPTGGAGGDGGAGEDNRRSYFGDGAFQEGAPPPHPLRSCEYALPPGYRLDTEGLWYSPGRRGDGGEAPDQWIGEAFSVIAMARDEEGQDWSLVIDFNDPDHRTKREIIGKAELAGEGVEVRRRLLGAGLNLSSSKGSRERFVAALAGLKALDRATLANSTGWKRGAYVLPHRTISGPGAERVIYRGRVGSTHHGEAGLYSAWRSEVAAKASGNAVLMFALSCGFAAPLLRALGGEGGGFQLRGDSSCGKTTALTAAGSVWGGGGPNGMCQTWRNTDNALEAVALAHNDCLLPLDELKALAPEAAGVAAYALATGATKGRLHASAELKARPSWRVLILSTGELSLADLIRQARGRERAYAGQELRLIDIEADMGCGLGAWQKLHDAAGPAEFSDALAKAARANYGSAGPLFVERFMAREAELIKEAAGLMQAFAAGVSQAGDTSQVQRAAQRFALVAAAGELAAVLDVTPWQAGEASAAASALFHRWARAFGRRVAREDREARQVVRRFLERFEGSRFRWLRDGLTDEEILAEQAAREDAGHMGRPREGEARALDVAGWKGDHEGKGRLFHFNAEFWKSVLFEGMDAIAAARSLKKAGLLISNGEGGRLTNKVKTPEGMRNFYSVSAKILEADADD